MASEVEILDQVLDAVEELKTASKTERVSILKEAKDMVEKSDADRKKEAEQWFKDLSNKVEEINTEVAKKGATVSQLMEELEEFKSRKGRIIQGAEVESTMSLLAKAFEENHDVIKLQANKPKARAEFEMKAVGTMTGSANLTGNVVASYADTPALRGRRKTHIRDLVRVIPSATGLWKFYRQNTPVGEGSFQVQSTHGAVKSQLDYDFTEVTVTVDYLAGFVRIAKQMLQDLPFMQSYVSNELVEDYLRAEDNLFFGQLYSAATGGGTLSGTVTVEKIIDAVANIEENDYEVNGIVATGPVWAKILKTKPSDYSIPGGVTISANGDVNIVGIPLVKVPASNIGNNMVLLGDWSKAAIIQTEGLNVNVYEQDSDNVQRNLVTIKAEARVAFAILRPDAFAYFSAGTT